MNADDAAALADLEQKIEKAPHAHEAAVPWLVRIAREQEARVKELEAGGVPHVIAAKDAVIADRDAQMAKLSERVAKFEKDHLPDPVEYYRELEKDRGEPSKPPKPKDDSPKPKDAEPAVKPVVAPAENSLSNIVASPSDAPKDDVKQHPVTPHPGRGQQTQT